MHFYVILILCFLYGSFCSFTFDAINIFRALVLLVFVFGVKLAVFRGKSKFNLCFFALITAFTLGAVEGFVHEYRTFKDVKGLYGMNVTFDGTVSEAEEHRFLIETEQGRFTVYNYMGARPENNQKVTVRGILEGYPVASYRGGFDSKLYNALNGNLGYITCNNIELKERGEGTFLRHITGKARAFVEQKVMNFNGGDVTKGFIVALLTGNKAYFDKDAQEDFALTGISHLTAVSGLHVGIFLSFFLVFSKGFRKNRLMHVLFIITLIVLYVMLVGESASILRAGIMTVFSYLVFGMRRRSDSMMNLMIAGLIICVVNPYYVVNPGFLMSFIATFGIILFAGYFKRQFLAVPLIAWLFMVPFNIYYYNVFSMETVIVNLATVPLVPFVILFGYLGCVFPFLSYISCAVSDFILYVAEFFASVDFLHISVPSTEAYQFAIWVLFIVAAYMTLEKARISAVTVIVVFAMGIFINANYSNRKNGQGLCYVDFINNGSFNVHHVKTENNKDVFIDCGFYTADYALKNGINDIYAVIISGTDKTLRKGIEELCRTCNVGYVVLPESLKKQNLKLEKTEVLYYNQNSHEFSIDGVNFKITQRDGQKCLLVGIYDDVIAIPQGNTMSGIGPYTVISASDKFTDGAKAVYDKSADYYIHPSYRNSCYEYSDKYITAQTGTVQMIFGKKIKPILNVF